jgi:ribose transport system permease protein
MITTLTNETTYIAPAARLRGLFTRAYSREITLLVLIVIMVATASLLYPRTFPTGNYALTIVNNLAADGVLAIGMMMLMVAGMFDLSVGSMLALGGVLLAYFMGADGLSWPLWLAVPASLVLVGLCGFFNGWLVAKVGVNALIATLGTMGIFRGIALLVGGTGQRLPEHMYALPLKAYWGLVLLAVVAVVFHYLLAHTRFFRQFYYVGGNAKAAELSGIPVARLQVWAFVIMALLAASAGMAETIRSGGASATAGVGAELQAITAVVLGGASLSGGKGTVLGALLGVIFMALTRSIMNFEDVNSNWQLIIVSSVLVVIVAIDSWLNRQRR